MNVHALSAGFKEGDWEGALTQSFLTLDRRLAGEEGQQELVSLAKAEKDRTREQVRGREPEVTLEDVAEQTGLSQASIRQYVLAAWRRRPVAAGGRGEGEDVSSGSEEEGGEREGRRGGAAAASAAAVPASSAEGVEVEEDEEEEETTAATTSDVSSGSTGSSGSSSSLESQVSPLPVSASAPVEEAEAVEEEVEEVVVLVQTTTEVVATVVATEEGSGSSGSSGSEEEEEEESEEEEDEALRSIDFRRVKEQLLRPRPGYDSGCTAVVALLVGGREGAAALVVANAGDSRCVLSRGGKAVDMSRDHKPDDPLELARIQAAGGSVAEGRVQGNLNLSRAIGDLTYKDARLAPARQMITALPETLRVPLGPADEFVVLACDGIWNVLTSQDVVDHVRAGLARGASLSALCEELCDRVRAALGWSIGCRHRGLVCVLLSLIRSHMQQTQCCDQNMDESDGSGLDNISVVIVALPSAASSAASAAPTAPTEEAGQQQQQQLQQQHSEEQEKEEGAGLSVGPAAKRAKLTIS